MRSMRPLSLTELDDQPFRVGGTVTVDAPPYAVFAELADPSLWYPLMKRSVWKTGATSGVGAEREVFVRTFGVFRERMLAWDVDRRVVFTMVATTSPLVDEMAEEWIIGEQDGRTTLTWRVSATPAKLGRPLTPALKAIMRVMFTRACKQLGKRAASYPKQRGTQVS